MHGESEHYEAISELISHWGHAEPSHPLVRAIAEAVVRKHQRIFVPQADHDRALEIADAVGADVWIRIDRGQRLPPESIVYRRANHEP